MKLFFMIRQLMSRVEVTQLNIFTRERGVEKRKIGSRSRSNFSNCVTPKEVKRKFYGIFITGFCILFKLAAQAQHLARRTVLGLRDKFDITWFVTFGLARQAQTGRRTR